MRKLTKSRWELCCRQPTPPHHPKIVYIQFSVDATECRAGAGMVLYSAAVIAQGFVPTHGRRHYISLWCARIALCLVLVCDLCVVLCASRSVRTLSGIVSGVVVTPQHPRLEAVEVFKGLPYAATPKRFSPPQPASSWRGVRTAGRFAPACPQRFPDIRDEAKALKKISKGHLEYLKRVNPLLTSQSEDCLYLNVYRPLKSSVSTKLPVLVLVEGESFEWSPGHLHDGSVLASYGNLVVITLSYRLGLVGFLSADPTRKTLANFGLLDIIAALRWVQDNIQEFGGDPETVTLAGHGSGAACVHWLMTSPSVAPGTLFRRVILMSGSAASIKSSVRDPWAITQKIASHVNCPLDHRLLNCLRDRPLEALMSTPLDSSKFSTSFGPSEDGVVIVRG
ncbi:neurexin protein binding, partial [Homalodisca vitripennis]